MEFELIAFGLITGFTSGFFGIGGGSILIPMLLFANYAMKEAVAISIMQMVFSSIYGSFLNSKKIKGLVRDGVILGIGASLGGATSGYFLPKVPDIYLQYLFITALLYTIYTLFKAPASSSIQKEDKSVFVLLAIGYFVGILAMSIGIGGSLVLLPILVGFLKYDLKTSCLGSMPGGVIEMAVIGEELKADTSKITLLQSSRLFFIVISLPFIIHYIFQIDISGNKLLTTPIKDIDLFEFSYVYILGFLGAIITKKLKITAAYLIGPMLISIVLYSSDFAHIHIPDELLKFIQIIFGTIIGFTFKDVDLKTIFKILLATFGHFLIVLSFCSIFIFIIYKFLDFKALDILLAFGPGGQTEINLMAILVGANLPYITLHHIVRIFLIMNIAPIIAKRL